MTKKPLSLVCEKNPDVRPGLIYPITNYIHADENTWFQSNS